MSCALPDTNTASNVSHLCHVTCAEYGPGSSVGIATCYGLEGPGIESRRRAKFSAPVQTGPGHDPASYKMVTGSFPGSKAAGAWRWPLTPSSAEVKDRVELYLYSPSGPSWPVIGWTLHLPLPLPLPLPCAEYTLTSESNRSQRLLGCVSSH
jgi:hypothetical protein